MGLCHKQCDKTKLHGKCYVEKEVTEKERRETEVLVIKSESIRLWWETNEQKGFYTRKENCEKEMWKRKESWEENWEEDVRSC